MEEPACDNCKAATPTSQLRAWVHHHEVDLRHLPSASIHTTMRLCPECHAAAREDEDIAHTSSRHVTLVLGGIFILLLVATLAMPTLWTSLARQIYGMSNTELKSARSTEVSSTPWAGHSFSPPANPARKPGP